MQTVTVTVIVNVGGQTNDGNFSINNRQVQHVESGDFRDQNTEPYAFGFSPKPHVTSTDFRDSCNQSFWDK